MRQVPVLKILSTVIVAGTVTCGLTVCSINRQNIDWDAIPKVSVNIVAEIPHDPQTFTQGLVFINDTLIETSGLKRQSFLHITALDTGRTLKRYDFPDTIFAEGVALWGDDLYALSWTSERVFKLSYPDLVLKETLPMTGEGWGLTVSDNAFYLSNGTSNIQRFATTRFTSSDIIKVHSAGEPILNLNELEWIDGAIFANIWKTDQIIKINVETGDIEGRIDLSLLQNRLPKSIRTRTANGIAYDAERGDLYVTGKNWPKIFVLKFNPSTPSP